MSRITLGKRDGNEAELVRVARNCGMKVTLVACEGFDLVVKPLRGLPLKVVEVKNPDGRDRLTDSQLEAQRIYGDDFLVWRTEDDVLALVNGSVRNGPIG